MCAPIPFGVHLRLNSIYDNLHSRAFFARRALAIESRQAINISLMPQASQETAPQVEASSTLTNLPPYTESSLSKSVSISGLTSPGIQTLSIAPSMSTVYATYVPNVSLSPATPTWSFTPNLASLKTAISTVLSPSGSAAASSVTASSTWNISYTYDTTSSLVSTTTITPVIVQSSDSLLESFTPAPSSTFSILTDPSCSVIASITTNDTAPAAGTSPIPVRPASLSAHNPPLYIGILLGTLVAIACLCALISWFIRLRSHARRRRAARSLKIPWAKSDDGDTWGLESGRGPGFNMDLAAISAMNLGSREDLADVQAWSPRGDRDVGEPRRTESYMKGSTYSLQNHPIPAYCLFSDDSVRAFSSSEGYSTASLLPHHNLRQLPSHLIDQELVARVSREHASLRSNENIDPPSPANKDYGTPRETMSKPRFLSLRGDGLNVPWHPNSDCSPRSVVERLRNHGKPLPTEPPWQKNLPLHNLDEINKNVEAEPWSSSFRNSLVSAFNAVAANLSSVAGAPRMDDDEFTPVAPKRSARKSVRDTFWDEKVVKTEEISRETSISSVTSKAWTLEETREGAGVVRLFIPSLQEFGDDTVVHRPGLSGPALSFGDGDDIISDGDDDSRRYTVEHPQVPLIASEKPPPAVIRPDPYHTRRNTRTTVNSSLVRGESIYSTASMHIGDQTSSLDFQPRPDYLSILPANPYYDRDSSDSIVIAPSHISRLSSSDSSTTSTILDGTTGVTKEGLNAASRALKDRRSRMLEV